MRSITHVQYTVTFQVLGKVEPTENTYGMALAFVQEWYDVRLQQSERSSFQIQADQIWTPQTVFMGFESPIIFEGMNSQMVTIFSNGKVVMHQQIRVRTLRDHVLKYINLTFCSTPDIAR